MTTSVGRPIQQLKQTMKDEGKGAVVSSDHLCAPPAATHPHTTHTQTHPYTHTSLPPSRLSPSQCLHRRLQVKGDSGGMSHVSSTLDTVYLQQKKKKEKKSSLLDRLTSYSPCIFYMRVQRCVSVMKNALNPWIIMGGGDYVRGAQRAHLADRQKNHPDRIAGGFAHKDFMFLDNNHLDADQTYSQSDFLSSRTLFCF